MDTKTSQVFAKLSSKHEIRFFKPVHKVVFQAIVKHSQKPDAVEKLQAFINSKEKMFKKL